MTEVLRVDPAEPDPHAIARAAACLRGGGLVAFPTETVYGLGVHALDRDAVVRLFAAKERPANDPLIVHVTTTDALALLVAGVPREAHALAARFWPGPLTIVLRRSRAVPDEVTAGLDTVAVRMPSHPVARALIDAARIPIAAPSANLFSRPSPTEAAHVLADLDGRIDMLVDGGPAHVGLESTVLDLSQDPPVVLRPGAVGLEMLRTVLPNVTVRGSSESESAAPQSPGLMSKHYSPRTPVILYEGDAATALTAMTREAETRIHGGETVAILAFAEDAARFAPLTVQLVPLGRESDPAEVAARLYAALRECDDIGADVILCRILTTQHALSAAIQDRLRRAAASTRGGVPESTRSRTGREG
jgi:L-threonylcarbamoyladenylate synthase